jgi:hypothetical protein
MRPAVMFAARFVSVIYPAWIRSVMFSSSYGRLSFPDSRWRCIGLCS